MAEEEETGVAVGHAACIMKTELQRGILQQALSKLGQEFSCPLQLHEVVRAVRGLMRGLLQRCTVLLFRVREADSWTIYERLAFRERMLTSMMQTSSPGVSMAESDLIRSYLLSHICGEVAQVEAYARYWCPIERMAAAAANAFEAGAGATTAERGVKEAQLPLMDLSSAIRSDPNAFVGTALSTVRAAPQGQAPQQSRLSA